MKTITVVGHVCGDLWMGGKGFLPINRRLDTNLPVGEQLERLLCGDLWMGGKGFLPINRRLDTNLPVGEQLERLLKDQGDFQQPVKFTPDTILMSQETEGTFEEDVVRTKRTYISDGVFKDLVDLDAIIEGEY